MAIRVNPKLIDELEHYGSEDVQNCYHCGNCSAVCPHTDETFVFPRRPMRFLQMGLERKLEGSLTPWLCYYCGQCSDQCPREAEPGETMMSLRRWLTSRYDFTGIAGLLYKSWKLELAAVLVIAILSGVAFFAYGFSKGNIHIYDGSGAFLPSSMIHNFDRALMLILGIILAINVLRMWHFTIGSSKSSSIPWLLYIKKAYVLPLHFFSQKRYSRCEPGSGRSVYLPWLVHLGLALGYVTMLVVVVFFLHHLQAGPGIQWSVHVFCYFASIGLLIGTVYMLHGRLRRTHAQYRRSHSTDWMFLWLLFYMVVTGVVQHILHRAGLVMPANIAYVMHLMGVVPWLLRMPFSKWAHLIYRPMAMYFAEIVRAAVAAREPARYSLPRMQPAVLRSDHA